ncbi:uncharacterized protein LOC113863478 isoform X2 [Abrus precatorius]|uniref:Uncharacterized protein LOC113863478 isoform X2 n=1 Tax=Abrus precatorius TaxID=3816 RepID=A0A8B8L9H8_ABRPR|nr:uncharacterized protein LOC113863478 isoform X2 [Abrus precatorius]
MEGFPQQESDLNQSGQLDRIEADIDDEGLKSFKRFLEYKNYSLLYWVLSLTHNHPKNASTFKAFLVCLLLSVIGLSPRFHWALLMLSCGFLIYQANSITTQFYSQFGNSTNSNAPHSLPLLSFSEAFAKLLPVMKPITMFILSYPVTLLLACPIQLILQIFIMLLLIFVPFHNFSEIVGKVSSGVNVAFGPFHLPLIVFTILGAFALSLILLLVILLGLYLFWLWILKGRPSLKNIEGSVKDLSEILIGI